MDIVQVKYEMLKDAAVGTRGIADEFGFSRASFYKINDAFDSKGLSALVPEKTGPKKPNTAKFSSPIPWSRRLRDLIFPYMRFLR